MFTLITANLVNFAGNWILIFGQLGAPAMGTAGSAWSTVIARVYMAGMLIAYACYEERWRLADFRGRSLAPDFARMGKLLALGLPAAAQIVFEIGVFAIAGALIGRLGEVPLAAHQITLHTISTTFMVTLGLSSAAAVRVGQALGRGEARAAAHSGWTAIALGATFMLCCALPMLVFPKVIGRIFTTDRAVIDAAVKLLTIGAVFQIFDGIQTCAMGALRGAGDTRTPMLCHLIGYWVIGLPAGYVLCFRGGRHAVGMWTGLSCSVILIAVVLVWIWVTRTSRILNRPIA